MTGVQQNHKSSFKNLEPDQNFAATRQKALIWYKHTLLVQICSKRLTEG